MAGVAALVLRQQQIIEVAAGESRNVQGDATLLGVMVCLVLEDAVRDSGQGATIRVAVSASAAGGMCRWRTAAPEW